MLARQQLWRQWHHARNCREASGRQLSFAFGRDRPLSTPALRVPLRIAAMRCRHSPQIVQLRLPFGGTQSHRLFRSKSQVDNHSITQILWIAAALVTVFGGVWLFVPIYKLYCQSTGQGQATFGGFGHKEYSKPPDPESKAAKRLIDVDFAATVHDALPWEFTPQQRRITVGLGETALAFYRAKNKSDRPIIGVSVYHMMPPETGLYFNKIQCFCFDEQLINPGEEVDLPILFYIDPMWGDDQRFDHINHVSLSYVFFESDSDIPEEYEDMIRATPTQNLPPSLRAPLPERKAAIATGT